MKKIEFYIVGITSEKVNIEDLLAKGVTCTLTPTGKLIFKGEEIAEMDIDFSQWATLARKKSIIEQPPVEDIEVIVDVYGTYGAKAITILYCCEVVNESEVASEEIKSISDNEFLVTRAINGEQESIILTKEEMKAIHSKMERYFKISELLSNLNDSLDSNIEYESLSSEQKEILEKVENAFEDSLMEDIGPVYDATISSYKEELKMVFPDLDFDIEQFA